PTPPDRVRRHESGHSPEHGTGRHLPQHIYRPPSPTIGVVALAVDPLHPTTVYAATYGTSGGNLVRTRDGGASWAVANVGLPSEFGATQLVIDPGHPDTVYLVSGFQHTPFGISRS